MRASSASHRPIGRAKELRSWASSFLLACLLMPAPVHAALFELNDPNDEPDLMPGDGICDASLAEGEQCNLRAAVEEADALPGDDIVRLTGGVSYLLENGVAGPLEVSDLTGTLTLITAAGTPGEITIDFGGVVVEEMFSVTSHLIVQNVVLRDAGGPKDAVGYAIHAGGTVEVTDTVFQNNLFGIGSYSGTTTVTDSDFNNNATGVSAEEAGTINVSDSTFYRNDQAAIVQTGGTLNLTRVDVTESGFNDIAGQGSITNGGRGQLTVVDSEIHDNFHRGVGVWCSDVGSETLILGTTIANNDSGFLEGAGINVYGALAAESSCYSTAYVVNSTISGNVADEDGGGIRAEAINGGGPFVYVQNSTIAENMSNGALFGSARRGAGLDARQASIILRNSIVTNNRILTVDSFINEDCVGTIDSEGYNNLRNPAEDCVVGGDTTGNLLFIDPLLGPLADNGGPTRTYGFESTSAVVDAGNPAGCMAKVDLDSPEAILTQDQRHKLRPADGDDTGPVICDPGAFELQSHDSILSDNFEG